MRILSRNLLVLLVPAALFVILMGRFLFGSSVLLTTDAVISYSEQSAPEVFRQFASNWNDLVLIGIGRSSGTPMANMLKAGLSGIQWNNLHHAIAMLLSSIALFAFFRQKKIFAAAGCMALMTACWVGSNFTIIFAGHPSKPFVVLFFMCSLIPVRRAAAGSIPYALIWGSCTGLMFAQQPDVAMFFALCGGAYLVFSLWRQQGFSLAKWMKILLPAALVAFLFAAGPLLSGYKHHVKGAAEMQAQTPEQKWNYITQWSWVPSESIAFVAPGYMGLQSGVPESPYWGRTGRSPGWEKTGQGFRNFKLDAYYFGIIPFAFALYALFSCRRSSRRPEILFWTGAAIATLLLAFGKFFPLYALFFKLPVVNSIRSPVKFLQVFQVCLAILAAFGVDRLFTARDPESSMPEGSGGLSSDAVSQHRAFLWIMTGAAGVLALLALSLTLGRGGDIDRFLAQGWSQDVAQVIVKNKIAALWHATGMAAIVVAVFALFSFSRFEKVLRFRAWIAAGLILIVAVDAIMLSHRFIKEMPRSYIRANALTGFIKEELGHQRVALLSQQGIFNLWITYLFPYNRIPTVSASHMARMPVDYQQFLKAAQRDPLNMWRSSAVKYLVAPTEAEGQLLAVNCRKVFAFNIFSAPDEGYGIAPDIKGRFAVFELSGSLPRYALFAGSRKGPDEAALRKLSDFSTVTLAEESSLPELSGVGQTGSVEVLSYRSGRVKLAVKTDVPAILRCADKYDVDWKASVDGKPAEVGRVDFINQGVSIPAGSHEVILRYAPSKLFIYMQGIGYLILFASLGIVLLRPKGTDAAD